MPPYCIDEADLDASTTRSRKRWTSSERRGQHGQAAFAIASVAAELFAEDLEHCRRYGEE